eukprot:g4261.t1
MLDGVFEPGTVLKRCCGRYFFEVRFDSGDERLQVKMLPRTLGDVWRYEPLKPGDEVAYRFGGIFYRGAVVSRDHHHEHWWIVRFKTFVGAGRRSKLSVRMAPGDVGNAWHQAACVENDGDRSAWVQCQRCGKWRRLEDGVPEWPRAVFECANNTWDERYASCDMPQEDGATDDDEEDEDKSERGGQKRGEAEQQQPVRKTEQESLKERKGTEDAFFTKPASADVTTVKTRSGRVVRGHTLPPSRVGAAARKAAAAAHAAAAAAKNATATAVAAAAKAPQMHKQQQQRQKQQKSREKERQKQQKRKEKERQKQQKQKQKKQRHTQKQKQTPRQAQKHARKQPRCANADEAIPYVGPADPAAVPAHEPARVPAAAASAAPTLLLAVAAKKRPRSLDERAGTEDACFRETEKRMGTTRSGRQIYEIFKGKEPDSRLLGGMPAPIENEYRTNTDNSYTLDERGASSRRAGTSGCAGGFKGRVVGLGAGLRLVKAWAGEPGFAEHARYKAMREFPLGGLQGHVAAGANRTAAIVVARFVSMGDDTTLDANDAGDAHWAERVCVTAVNMAVPWAKYGTDLAARFAALQGTRHCRMATIQG